MKPTCNCLNNTSYHTYFSFCPNCGGERKEKCEENHILMPHCFCPRCGEKKGEMKIREVEAAFVVFNNEEIIRVFKKEGDAVFFKKFKSAQSSESDDYFTVEEVTICEIDR